MNITNNAVIYKEHGDPGDVLFLEELPVEKLGAREVRIEIVAASIHPSDIGLVQGSYGNLKKLPAVAGREGVGKVIEIGYDVPKDVMNKIVSVPDKTGAWQSYCNACVDDLILLPALVPYNQLAVSILNPMTAWRLLNDLDNTIKIVREKLCKKK